MENIQHAFRKGTKTNKGSCNPKSKLCEDDIIIIRSMIKEGLTLSSIAKIYNISNTSVSYIKSRKSWSHI